MPVLGVPTCRRTRSLTASPSPAAGAGGRAPGTARRPRARPRRAAGQTGSRRVQVAVDRVATAQQRIGASGSARAWSTQSACSSGTTSGGPATASSRGTSRLVQQQPRRRGGTDEQAEHQPHPPGEVDAVGRHVGRPGQAGRRTPTSPGSSAGSSTMRTRSAPTRSVQARAMRGRSTRGGSAPVAGERVDPVAPGRGRPRRRLRAVQRRASIWPRSVPSTSDHRRPRPPGGRPAATSSARTGSASHRVADQPVATGATDAGSPAAAGPAARRRRRRRPAGRRPTRSSSSSGRSPGSTGGGPNASRSTAPSRLEVGPAAGPGRSPRAPGSPGTAWAGRPG